MTRHGANSKFEYRNPKQIRSAKSGIQWPGRLAAGLALALFFVGCGEHRAPATPTGGEEFIFGIVMTGPITDRGWYQAVYDAGRQVEQRVPGAKLIYIDNVNASAKPGVSVPQVVDQLVARGAMLIITASEDLEDGTLEAARRYPGLPFLNVGGDQAWKDGMNFRAPANVSNLMGRMEYAKAMAGFAAALTTKTGKIGYVGPLNNSESRRLAAAAYLGARYAWTRVLKRPIKDLAFEVVWIGFWFNIPGQTLDPTKVSGDFLARGFDVLISGINTTEALVMAGKLRKRGQQVWAIPYDYFDAGREAPEVSLGVPVFYWGEAFTEAVLMAKEKRWTQYFAWKGPDWKNLNDTMTSTVGFIRGEAMTPEVGAQLDRYIADLGAGRVKLFSGPLAFQDGTVFLPAGREASDTEVFYLPKLLEGMTGQ